MTLLLHFTVFLLLLEIVIVLVIIVVQRIARIFRCFGKVDRFPTCAPAVSDNIVRVDFLHVVFIFFFGCSRTGISQMLISW